jgi:hypothetical protein
MSFRRRARYSQSTTVAHPSVVCRRPCRGPHHRPPGAPALACPKQLTARIRVHSRPTVCGAAASAGVNCDGDAIPATGISGFTIPPGGCSCQSSGR